MIWLAALALAALTLAPLLLLAWRARAGHGVRLRGRQEAALALHRAQLTELDNDLAEGRLLTAEHQAAKLEVQRRLLADAALPDGAAAKTDRYFIPAVAMAVPIAALLLYLATGRPGFPPPDTAPPVQADGAGAAPDPARIAQDQAAIGQLRNRLALMDPHADQTLRGYEILGNAELSMGHLPEAAAAWQHVLADRFDPTLAAQTAEVLTETSDHVTPAAMSLFKRALAAAPADAPWRKMAEKRVAEGAGG
jgi:cytochrome c-type biogenesis protein CcmH